MTTIELPQRLMNSLQQLVTEQGSSIETVVEDALTGYLREQRHRLLLQEMERFRAQHEQLKKQYLGEFVGLYNGNVLDHDPDGGTLYNRLRQQYGDLPILIVEVTQMPEQEFVRLQRRILT